MRRKDKATSLVWLDDWGSVGVMRVTIPSLGVDATVEIVSTRTGQSKQSSIPAGKTEHAVTSLQIGQISLHDAHLMRSSAAKLH